MIALLLAAQLSAGIVTDAPADAVPPPRHGIILHRGILPPKLAFAAGRICPPNGVFRAQNGAPSLLRPQDRHVLPQKLGEMPPAHKEIAVQRSVGGCTVPVGVRYDVEQDGRFANPRD